MDSQTECSLIDARLDPGRRVVEHNEQRARACRGQSEQALVAAEHELACEAAEACEWAAEMSMLAAEDYAREHGLEMPCA